MLFGVIIDLSNETKNRSRKGFKMTKKAMVDRMIELGIYKEADRSYVMRYLKEQLEKRIQEHFQDCGVEVWDSQFI